MSNYVNRADAIVALKSFGRRYSELIAGPIDDDAWERLVRTSDATGKSALAYVATAIEDLSSVATLAMSIGRAPSSDGPFLQTVRDKIDSQAIAELQAMVKSTSQTASSALDARLDEDYDKQVTIAGRTVSVGNYVSDVVNRLAANLRHGQAAIDDAR
jgi:hypothetical protein